MTTVRGRGPTLAKDVNRMRIYRHLKQQRETTRADIARALTLNKNTVNTIVEELLEAGYATETGLLPGSGAGRKAVGIRYRAENRWAAGMQLTSTTVHCTATDLYAEPLASFSFPLPSRSPQSAADAVLEGWTRLAGILKADGCIGIGIGIPGLLDAGRAAVLASSHLGWTNVPFLAMLQDRPIPARLQLDNSVKYATLGEQRQGAGQGADHFVYAYFGNGIGCGIYTDGRLLRGEAGAAGELGHIVVDPDGPVCECGNRGCLEAIAGLPGLLTRLAARVGIQAAEMTIARFAVMLEAGDRAAADELERLGGAVGQAMSFVVNLLNPKLIVCDGPLMELADRLFPLIGRELSRRCVAVAAGHVSLVRSRLYPSAGSIGAAESVIYSWEEGIDPLLLVTGRPSL